MRTCRALLAPACGVLATALVVCLPASAQDAPEEPPPETAMVEPTASEAEAPLQITGEFRRELRTVEGDVNHLKERVFRSKATLQLLKELVIEGSTVGSRVVVWHVNQLGGAYSMESLQFFLDRKNVYTKVDPGGQLDSMREVKVHEQTVPPGTHTLQVTYVLRGHGFGLFSYLRDYQFKMNSSYQFQVEEGKATVVRAVVDSKGGLRKRFVDKPSVKWDQRIEALREEAEAEE